MAKRAKAVLPYMEFYPRDFFTDPLVEIMSAEEVGAYMLLICRSWFDSPGGSVADDDRSLARWTHLSEKRWRAIKANVMKPWELRDDGRWYQKRVVREYKHAVGRSKAGSLSAQKRWEKERKKDHANADANGHANAYANASNAQCESDAPKPIPIPNPDQNNPTQPNPEHEHASAGGIGNGGAARGLGEGGQTGNLGGELSREEQLAALHRSESGLNDFVETKALLGSTGMYAGTVTQLMKNPSVTLARVRAEIDDIRRTGGAKELPSVLSKRLGHRPKRKR